MIKSKSLQFHAGGSQSPPKRICCSGSVDEIKDLIHTTRSSHWEPPWASWRCRLGLPYGWEQAKDNDGNTYYIDHLNRTTTYTDPRKTRPPDGKRTVSIRRGKDIGFGFVAAGQLPTIIQFVSPEGPSDGLLYANDQILEVNGLDMQNETKDNVVNAVRAAKEELQITVQQLPQRPKSSRKNCKVRFTDRVLVSSTNDNNSEFPPLLPNVLRVYLENGQTRSFKYDQSTTVKQILESILEKLQISAKSHFSLAVEYSLGARTSRISLLRPDCKIKSIVDLPNSEHLRCVFRLSFAPSDAFVLLLSDPKALEYYYQQCVNDVVRGRFAMEMRYEACIRLAALHVQQVAYDCNILKENNKVSVHRVEKEYGLGTFLPAIVLENVKRRDVRKHIRFYLKRDSSRLVDCFGKPTIGNGYPPELEACAAQFANEPSMMVRLRYIHIVSHLPSFGGRSFCVTFKESQIDMLMQVEPRTGLLVRHPGKSGQPSISIGFDLIGKLVVCKETEVASMISIRLASNPHQGLEFLVDKDDLDDLVMYIVGYHKVTYEKDLLLEIDDSPPKLRELPDKAPPYSAIHTVVKSDWNYSETSSQTEKPFDPTDGPPSYEIANSFVQIAFENEQNEDHFDTEISRQNGESFTPKRAHFEPKKLLRATDSLLIKNSRDLHAKELEIQNGGSQNDESSDTEDSSFSSPLRSPNIDRLCDGINLLVTGPPARRASIETLLQNNQNPNTNLESLILQFPTIPDENEVENDDVALPEGMQTSTTTVVANGKTRCYRNGSCAKSYQGENLISTPVSGDSMLGDSCSIAAIDDDIPLL
ncbi:FERM and PDZ domain-containing protein 4 [Caenorhabditis elegans]|uniref:FERM and PDZ domain-containing protein 4 n=2 Tax=Caenorhabditis elegans TaxID=6239 RepID=Q8MXE9_CAEEL|nr:FERM and PDZ domain-containing protein 4 [Caenorhabditis elegans]CCD72288.1 FERM and PDZ domain-containing protein 4 [Caenorhabditis elegans]|eukprot:NP_741110.1 FERM domain (protein4.1-ezrin-radixin-moesin) family [Caenorhabditis elegans]